MALAEMIAKRGNLTLPLKSHGYLLAIIEGYGSKAEARREQQGEDRKAGRTPVSAQTPVRAEPVEAPKPRGKMPATVKAALTKGGSNDGNS